MSKANKDGWIRHRGGKCPVEDRSTYINGRFRSGEQYHGPAYGVAWSHAGKPSDLMAWRPHKPEQKSLSSVAADGELWSDAKEMRAVETFAGPTQWRDRIREIGAASKEEEARHCAAMEAYDAELASLVAKLKAEGFALIQGDEPNGEVESDQRDIAQQDMSDPANWRVGDLVKSVNDEEEDILIGGVYALWKEPDINAGNLYLVDSAGDERNRCIEDYEFHSRPTT